MDRTALLLGDASRASRILEIGPSHAPIAPKRAGWNAFVVDHADQAGLRAKYAGFGVDLDAIEEVDAVWAGGRLDQAIPREHHGSFDRLIASHVIEHIPDPVTFLVSAQALLAPGGALALAVPDKRYCFDFLKPHATTGDLLASHDPNGPGRHSLRTLFNQVAHSAFLDAPGPPNQGAWGQHPVSQAHLVDALPDAFAMARRANAADYIDAHAWQFTPCAFELAILELAEGGVIDWHVDSLTGAHGAEFFATLRRGRREWPSAQARETRRMQLLLGILAELREQIDLMALGGMLPQPSLPADPVLGRHLSDLRAALAGQQAVLERLQAAHPAQEAALAELRDQLASITAAGGTQASIMGSLEQLAARQQAQQALVDGLASQLAAQNRMIASLTDADGTQASIMGSLELVAARQQHHQQAIADTSQQTLEAARLLHALAGRLDAQQRALEDQGRTLSAIQSTTTRLDRLLSPLARLGALLRRRPPA